MGLAVIFSVFLVSMLFPELNESDISRTTYLLSIYAILIFTGVIIQLMLVGSVLAIVKVIRIGSR